MPGRLRFQKGDIVAVALVALLAVAVFAGFLPGQEDAAFAQIYRDGQLLRTVALDQDQTFSLADRYTNTVTVRDGKIAITQSDCPGEDCVRSGWIGTAGRSIVCLPGGLEIRVVSGHSDVDFVVG